MLNLQKCLLLQQTLIYPDIDEQVCNYFPHLVFLSLSLFETLVSSSLTWMTLIPSYFVIDLLRRRTFICISGNLIFAWSMNTYSKPLNCPRDVLTTPSPIQDLPFAFSYFIFFISFILEKFSDFFFWFFMIFVVLESPGSRMWISLDLNLSDCSLMIKFKLNILGRNTI